MKRKLEEGNERTVDELLRVFSSSRYSLQLPKMAAPRFWTALFLVVVVLFAETRAQQSTTTPALKLTRSPASQEVRAGAEVVLECVFDAPANECVWVKDGESTIVRDPYQYRGSPSSGECSLHIPQVDRKRDDGTWQCQYPRVGSSPAVVSDTARLTVLVPPEEPEILHRDQLLSKGSTLTLGQVGENATLTCVSRRGNPVAVLYWMMEGQRMDGFQGNRSEGSDDQGDLVFSSENRLSIIVSPELQSKEVRCIAEHPAYQGQLHESYVNIEVHHNTTHVMMFTDNVQSGGNVEVGQSEDVRLYCIADGVPLPSYRWEFQRNGESKWEPWSYQQNLTVNNLAGKFACFAGNDYNVDPVRALDEINVKTTEFPSNAVVKLNARGSFAFAIGIALAVHYVVC